MIFRSLTTRVIFISISLLAFGISLFALLNLKQQQAQLTQRMGNGLPGSAGAGGGGGRAGGGGR